MQITVPSHTKNKVLWQEVSKIHHLSWLGLVTDQLYVVQCYAE